MEPMTLTATTIINLAFNEFIKSGAGELAKKSIGGSLDLLVKSLRNKIQAKFQGNTKAEMALAEMRQQGTPAALDKVTKYLDLEMLHDTAFATEIKQVAQQIINTQNQNISNREYKSYGRDQINIENIHGNNRIGGS